MYNEVRSVSHTSGTKAPISKQNKSVATSSSLFEPTKVSIPKTQVQTPVSIAQEIADEIFGFGRANLDKSIKKIKPDNVFKVLKEYKKISDNKNSFFNKKLDDETLFEAILDESISKEKKKQYISHIKIMMEQAIAKNQGNTEALSEVFNQALETALQKSWPFQNADDLNNCASKFAEINEQINLLKKLLTKKQFHMVICITILKKIILIKHIRIF